MTIALIINLETDTNQRFEKRCRDEVSLTAGDAIFTVSFNGKKVIPATRHPIPATAKYLREAGLKPSRMFSLSEDVGGRMVFAQSIFAATASDAHPVHKE